MSHPSKANVGHLIDFKWGIKRGVGKKNKNFQFYESFTYEGVEYFLYDCVYFYNIDHVETSIGKLVKIYERPNHEKIVKVVWFFRPTEVRSFLGDYQPGWNELFLASGEGKGVSNVNYLESIIRKCNVVCTSKDKRNPEPSEAELKMAHYIFSRSFDVGRRVIVDKFADEIDGVKVEQFFNRKRDQKVSSPPHVATIRRPKIVIKNRTNPSDVSGCQVGDKSEVRSSENVLPKVSFHSFPYKKRRLPEEKLPSSQSSKPLKEDEFYEKKSKHESDEVVKNSSKIMEVKKRPDAEKRRWFKQLPWEERLQKAQDLDTLVLLYNLDPSFTSYEVEDLVWHALKVKVEARMIEWSLTSNPYYGRAFVIFKTKDAAASAISKLNKGCLILGDGRVSARPVSAMKQTLRERGKGSKFTGHLAVDRYAPQWRRQEMRNAVSTSHCSQPNTIEFGMAMEWCLQQEKLDACWNALYKRQMREVQDVKSRLQMDKM